eukprot:2043552-Karenia_brevis.AAC.1
MPCASRALDCSWRSMLCAVTWSPCFSLASAVSGGTERGRQLCWVRLPARLKLHVIVCRPCCAIRLS